MANRRTVFDAMMDPPASPMTPKGGSQTVYGEGQPQTTMESRDTFRRRTTPVTGEFSSPPSGIEELLTMIRGQQ